MKKNLLILVILLTAVAVLSRYTRGREAEAALERELQAGLRDLWESPDQQVQIQGDLARIQVHMTAKGNPAWSFALARYVAARHPEVRLSQWEIRSGDTPVSDSPATVLALLEARQAQAMADQLIGPGKSLVLVEIESFTPVESEPRVVLGSQRKVERYERKNGNEPYPNEWLPPKQGDKTWECIRIATPPRPIQVRHFCVITSTPSGKELLAALMDGLFLEAEKGEDMRIVSCP